MQSAACPGSAPPRGWQRRHRRACRRGSVPRMSIASAPPSPVPADQRRVEGRGAAGAFQLLADPLEIGDEIDAVIGGCIQRRKVAPAGRSRPPPRRRAVAGPRARHRHRSSRLCPRTGTPSRRRVPPASAGCGSGISPGSIPSGAPMSAPGTAPVSAPGPPVPASSAATASAARFRITPPPAIPGRSAASRRAAPAPAPPPAPPPDSAAARPASASP